MTTNIREVQEALNSIFNLFFEKNPTSLHVTGYHIEFTDQLT